ncbi:U-box domain-containing protein 5-like isoform X2 [Gastrolobium bilobum]|uniref:U-box domain-containing protein 5-like isoform X2 n=1 Tax=Gastrolobium bilobum TaxID=150636 RepID=UPI002AB0A5CA|nr:U-box domain-containing protein 5-like isoform X2 [Gastrolobium bilobum]
MGTDGCEVVQTLPNPLSFKAMTGDSVLSKCKKAKKSLEKSLVQIQGMVPVMLAAEISGIIDDLGCVTFVLDSAEEEAGRVVRELLQQSPATSDKDSMENSEIESLQFAAARLNITSPTTILVEKRSIKKLLENVGPNDQRKKMILKYLLYLLIKYGNLIKGEQMEKVYSHIEGPIATENSGHDSQCIHHVKSDPYLNYDQCRTHTSELGRVTPPEEYTCPISSRLMFDPVVIASGETFERMWIQKWFDEGNAICPKTKKKLAHMALTPNTAIKDLILKWCKSNGVSIPDPSREDEDFHSWEASSTSIRSFGSSMNDLNFPMDLSNMSLGSFDTSHSSDSSHAQANHGLNLMLIKTSDNSHRHQSHADIHDTDLMHLSKLHDRQWDSQCQVIEVMKEDFECNYQAFCSVSSENFVDPLIRFLSTAYDIHDVKALRAGTQLLLEFMKNCRNDLTNLSEDTFRMLATLLDSEVIEEALVIMEELSGNCYDKATIAASHALPSVSKILDSGNKEFQRKAFRIMCNLSSNGEISPYMVSLGCIPKLLPFFEDMTLLRDCVSILKNLCDTEEGRVAFVETKGCISYVAEILGSGSDEEKELSLAILLSLCSQRVEYCELVMYEGIIPSLVNISNKGNDNAKAFALELLRLLRDVDYVENEDCIEPNLNTSRDSNNQEKKPSKKSMFLKKLSLFSKSSSLSSKNKR